MSLNPIPGPKTELHVQEMMKESNTVARKTINCVVMFAVVAGSTAMYENMGDDLARERISKALNMLISITRRHDGTLVKTIGDEKPMGICGSGYIELISEMFKRGIIDRDGKINRDLKTKNIRKERKVGRPKIKKKVGRPKQGLD